jgi:hypothetical protein
MLLPSVRSSRERKDLDYTHTFQEKASRFYTFLSLSITPETETTRFRLSKPNTKKQSLTDATHDGFYKVTQHVPPHLPLTHSLTHSLIHSLILTQLLVLATSGVTVTLLDQVADPASHALFTLRVFAQNRLAVLNFNGRRVDVEIWHVGVDVGAVDSVVAEAERGYGRTSIAEERLGFCEGFGSRCHCCRVAEERVHVFEADVGSFGVDEPDWEE